MIPRYQLVFWMPNQLRPAADFLMTEKITKSGDRRVHLAFICRL